MLLWRCFLDEINIEIVGFSVKQVTLHNWVGLIQPIEGFKTKIKAWECGAPLGQSPIPK